MLAFKIAFSTFELNRSARLLRGVYYAYINHLLDLYVG